MRKIMILHFLLVLMMALTVGCSEPEVTPYGNIGQDAAKIVVASYVDNDSGLEAIVAFEKPEEIEAVVQAFSTAVKIEGVLDVVEPDYIVDFHYDEQTKNSYLLWLDREEEYGMIMEQSDSHTGYKLTEGAVQDLLDLIPAEQ